MIKKELNPEQGKRLKECLEDEKMTQKELAEKSGYTKQYISNIVVGRKNMSLESAEKMAGILGVRKEYLLCKDSFKTSKCELEFVFETLGNMDEMFLSLFKGLCGINVVGQIIKTEEGDEFCSEQPPKALASEKYLIGIKTKIAETVCTPKSIELLVEINGVRKIIPMDMMYYLKKDIIEYIQFKGERFKKDVSSV